MQNRGSKGILGREEVLSYFHVLRSPLAFWALLHLIVMPWWEDGVLQMELAQEKATKILLCVPKSQNFLKTQERFSILASPTKISRNLPIYCIYDNRHLRYQHNCNMCSKKFLPMKKRRKPINTSTVCFEKFLKTNLSE